MTHRWEVPQRCAECFSLTGAFDRQFDGEFGLGHGPDCDGKAFLWQLLHQIRERSAFVPDQRAYRKGHVVEEQLSRVLPLLPNLAQRLPVREALQILCLHGKQGQPLRSGAASPRHDEDYSSHRAVGDERLRPVQDPAVFCLAGGGADHLQIRARIRLGHGDRADEFSRRQLRQESLLFGSAELHQVVRDDRAVNGIRQRVVTSTALLPEHGGLVGKGASASPQVLRHAGQEQAQASRLLPCKRVDAMLLCEAFLVGKHRLGEERPGQ